MVLSKMNKNKFKDHILLPLVAVSGLFFLVYSARLSPSELKYFTVWTFFLYLLVAIVLVRIVDILLTLLIKMIKAHRKK